MKPPPQTHTGIARRTVFAILRDLIDGKHHTSRTVRDDFGIDQTTAIHQLRILQQEGLAYISEWTRTRNKGVGGPWAPLYSFNFDGKQKDEKRPAKVCPREACKAYRKRKRQMARPPKLGLFGL